MLQRPNHPEVGRELTVSELPAPPGIVWVAKDNRWALASLRVMSVGETYVHLRARPSGQAEINLFLLRCGADLEQVTDDSHVPMAMYEYLGGDK